MANKRLTCYAVLYQYRYSESTYFNTQPVVAASRKQAAEHIAKRVPGAVVLNVKPELEAN